MVTRLALNQESLGSIPSSPAKVGSIEIDLCALVIYE